MKKTAGSTTSKKGLLNYLYGLRCDVNWQITGAINDNRGDEYIGALKDESKAIDTLVKLVKEKVPE